MRSIDDYKLKAVVEVLQQKLAKLKVPLKNFSLWSNYAFGRVDFRQEVAIQSGIPVEKTREIVKKIKDSKIKVQGSIQGDLVRVSGKSRDLLQEANTTLTLSDSGSRSNLRITAHSEWQKPQDAQDGYTREPVFVPFVPPCGFFVNLLFFDPVALHFPVEVAALEAEQAGGLRDVPVVFLQFRKDELPFVLRS